MRVLITGVTGFIGYQLLNDEKTLEQLGREARQHALKYDCRETYKPLLEILR